MPQERPGNELATISPDHIERKIYFIRGQKVMLDSDLAELYQVPTKSLNLAVRRNANRFPEDFMFQLVKGEAESLRFQVETSKTGGRGGRRYLPYVFTEHGVAMLATVLNSERAVQMNILIIRAFIKLRDMLATHKDLARAIEDLKLKQEEHGEKITEIIDTINQLLLPEPVPAKRRIGFFTEEEPEAKPE